MRLVLICAGAALALSACAPVPELAHLTAAADPNLQTRSIRNPPVTAGARTFRVVEPKDWRELNRQVTPPSEREGTSGRAAK